SPCRSRCVSPGKRPAPRSAGWAGTSSRGNSSLRPGWPPSVRREGGEGKPGEVPTFRWNPRGEKLWQPGIIAKLPAPHQPFGLDLRYTRVTDVDLKELARLEHLQALSLNGTQVTGAGLRHLAGLEQLRWLDLGNATSCC